MSIDFPSNPVQGQVYTFNSSNWVYNGYAWIAITPGDPILGAQFKQKNESQKFTQVLGGTNAVIDLQAYGQQYYAVIGPVTSIAGFSKALLTATPTAELPYGGKDFYFENKTDHNVTLKNAFSPIDIPFNLGADLIVPTNGIVWLKYNPNSEKMDLFFKSWTDLSGAQFKKKLESEAYADPILTGANAVIPLQPNGQSVYSFSNAGLVSIDGFGLNLITGNSSAEVPYPGKDILIFNNKSENLTLKHDGSGTADVKFLLENGVDLVVPPGGKVWLKYGPSYCELIFKSWTQIDLSSKADLVGGKVPSSQLPSYVDDVIEGYFNGTNFYKEAGFTNLITPESDKIYIDLGTNSTYRWSGTAYVKISDSAKLDKSTTASSVYGTNTAGGQTMIPLSELENVSNKATNLTSPDDTKYPTTLAVVNENKKATITVELINQLTTNFYAPNALRINSTALISGSGTITLKVNDVAYTLGNLITQGQKIAVETTTASVYNLISVYE